MKKQMLNGILPLLCGLLLLETGCKIDEPGPKPPPEGYVLEYGTEKPIPNAQVLVYGDCEGELLGSLQCKLLETVTSDQNGYYKSTVPNAFNVYARKEGYDPEYTKSSVRVLSGTETSTDIHLTPFAWLKVTLINESGAELIYVNGGHYLQVGEQKEILSKELGNNNYLLPFAVYPEEGGTLQSMDSVKIYNALGEQIAPNMNNSTFPRVNFYLPGHDTTAITIIY
jgi:hypothetical protein